MSEEKTECRCLNCGRLLLYLMEGPLLEIKCRNSDCQRIVTLSPNETDCHYCKRPLYQSSEDWIGRRCVTLPCRGSVKERGRASKCRTLWKISFAGRHGLAEGRADGFTMKEAAWVRACSKPEPGNSPDLAHGDLRRS